MIRSNRPGVANSSSGVDCNASSGAYGAVDLAIDGAGHCPSLGDLPAGIVGLVRMPGDVRLDFGEAMSVERQGAPIPGLDLIAGQLVEAPHDQLVVGGVDLAQHVAQRLGVEDPDRGASPQRRVGARPRVADSDHTGDHWVTVNDVGAVAILDRRHDCHAVRDRLSVHPVGGHRVLGECPFPRRRVAQRPQLLVAGAGHEADAPGAVVGRQGQDAQRVMVGEDLVLARRHAAISGAEVSPVVHEPAVIALDGRLTGIDRLEPRRQRRATPAGVDDEVGGDHPIMLGDHTGDLGDAGSAVVVGAESAHSDPPTDPQAWHSAGNRGDRTLEHRPSRGHRVKPLVAWTELAGELGGQRGQGVEPQPTASLQHREHLGKLGFDLAAPAGQHDMEHPELPDAAALPPVPGRLRIVNGFVGVALEHGDFVPIPSQQHRQGQPVHTSTQHHNLCHHAPSRTPVDVRLLSPRSATADRQLISEDRRASLDNAMPPLARPDGLQSTNRP